MPNSLPEVVVVTVCRDPALCLFFLTFLVFWHLPTGLCGGVFVLQLLGNNQKIMFYFSDSLLCSL